MATARLGMERSLTIEHHDRLIDGGISKCKVQSESEQTLSACPPSENSACTVQINSDDRIGNSNPRNETDQNDNKSQEHERPPPVVHSQSNGVPSETSDKPRAISAAGGGGEKTQRPSGTPLRLRRLPASFWQEPNVPKDPSGKLMPTTGDVCFGSCFGCQLHRSPFQNDTPFGYYGDNYGFRSKYLDPVSAAAFPRPGHSFASISKFSGGGGDPLELAYLDGSVVPWRHGGVASFPSAHPVGASSGDMRPVFAADRPAGSSSGRTMFSATAALYGHMMRRSLHGNYHHSNDVLTEHLTSPIVSSEDLWRLLPNRPLMNDFSKRFHPYL